MKENVKATVRNILTSYLEQNSLRKTPERFAILDAVYSMDGHFTLDELGEKLNGEQRFPVIRATLYNTLRLFSERKAALMITIDEHRVCYDGDTHPHVHFYCKECGKVMDFMDESAPAMPAAIEIEGNLVDEMQLYYKGVCAECRQRMAAKVS